MDTKFCNKCGRELPLSEFYKNRHTKDRLQAYCKSCSRKSTLESNHDLKNKVFDILGRECVICGFDDMRALQIDHINGDGADDRRKIGRKKILFSIIKNPDEAREKYQVLCANHNWIKRAENKEWSF